MDASRIIQLAIALIFYVLLINQVMSDDVNGFECPLHDDVVSKEGKISHNITRSVECLNGRNMAGCCLHRLYCNFNTTQIDLTLYGPPGYRSSCPPKLSCCPQQYILPVSLPKLNSTSAVDDNSSVSDDSFNDDDLS